ncbi:hypothetical protein [Blastococcus sp. LR1]|uniref:hypothetical protein n=1 Tax=Blastococcus sp. LR1 TaxID=2877000 RepID=UPI001CCDF144|nr:hypothetical protein [Blastococcus sp. LR1]MCA0146765.1 hypothetical protein [Blastococcus sp. LR1]
MTRPFELRSDEDGDLHVVLRAGTDPEGWSVTLVHRDGSRSQAEREGPGWFGYFGEVAAHWFAGSFDVAHVEVTGPSGELTVLHHFSFPPADCSACGAPELSWRVLQDRGDPAPYGVMAEEPSTGLLYRYVAGEGLVHWPGLADYVLGGEPGSRPVTQAEALQLIRDDVGRVNVRPFDVERYRGQAPTRPLPS